MVYFQPGQGKSVHLDIASNKYTSGDCTLVLTHQLLQNSYKFDCTWVSHSDRATRYDVLVDDLPSGIYMAEFVKDETTMYRTSAMVATYLELHPNDTSYAKTTTDYAYEG